MSSFSSTLDSQPVVYIGKTAAGRNYIGDGMKLSPNGLSVDVSTGYADIQGKYHETTQTVNQVLDARSANILYATKSTYSDSPTFGAVKATIPAVDADTVALWDFSGWDGTSAIPNSAVGVNGNTIAVANNLTKSGTVTRVDGWTGYAAQGDGSTGYFVSANSTGFPIGANERNIVCLLTYNLGVQTFLNYGAGGDNQGFGMRTLATGELSLTRSGAAYDNNTGYVLESGKTYYIEFGYTGTNFVVYVNGILVYNTTMSPSTVAGVLTACAYSSTIEKSKSTIRFIELRNKMRTPAQIAAISNKLCLPCSYESITDSINLPVMTSNNTPSGHTVLASSEYSATYAAWKAFDGDNGNTAWVATATTGTLTRTFSTPISMVGYILYPRGGLTVQSPTSWAFEITRDGGLTWENVDSRSGQSAWSDFTANKYLLSSKVSGISGFRITVTAINGGTALSIGELKVIEDTSTAHYDIRSILPTDSISLGFARTNSSAVVEIDDSSYKYGRREGAVGGNRRVFLGWKYFSGGVHLYWDNPFGTRNIKIIPFYADDASGKNATEIFNSYSGSTVGFDYVINPSKIQTQSLSGGLIRNTSGWVTSGYVGLWLEVID